MWKHIQTAAEDPCGLKPRASWPAAFLMSWHEPNCHEYEGTLDLLSVGLHNASASWSASTFGVSVHICIRFRESAHSSEHAQVSALVSTLPNVVFVHGGCVRLQLCVFTCFLGVFFFFFLSDVLYIYPGTPVSWPSE